MQEQRQNNETFKLLQLSDDSKSLSDLELPEITTQRKRKVRRKTRPRVTPNRSTEDVTSDNQCNRLIIWVGIFLISCWLLTLSYMLAVIHAESTRLGVQIKHGKANKKNCAGNGIHSQDQLLSPSTDEQDDIAWPKIVRSSNRTRHRKFSLIQTCIPIVFVMSVALSLGFVYWLHFDLKQQLYDYRNRIEEVTLTSQNVPDALQKLHEASKNLEQNQTLLTSKLEQIHVYIEDLRGRFASYEAKLNVKKDYPKDEKFVADFGADVKAVLVDVEHFKDKFAEVEKRQNDFRTEIDTLKTNFSEAVMNATRRANNNETDYSDELKKAQTNIYNEIKLLSANVSLINDTLSQKAKILTEDERSLREQIEALQERTANISSHVNSIELKWTPNKLIVNDYDIFKNNSNYELQSLKNVTIDLQNRIENVRLDCSKIRNDVLHSFGNTDTKEAQTAKKDMSRQNDKLLKLPDTIDKLTPNTSSNISETHSSGTLDSTPKSTVAPSPKPTSATTETSTVVVTVAEGKPKLLSIQTLSKPV